MLNLKREQMIHQSADELSLKNDLLRRLIRELVHPNEKHEPLKIYADDKESFFQAVYVPIKLTETETEGEKQVGNVILLKNITEFKELDSAKTTFISTISHELKTPISAIMMSLKLLEDQRIGSLNDEQQSLASSIKENSDRGATSYQTVLSIVGREDAGMVTKITEVIAKDPKITLRGLSINSSEGLFDGQITVLVSDTEHLSQLISRLKRIQGVMRVYRHDSVKE